MFTARRRSAAVVTAAFLLFLPVQGSVLAAPRDTNNAISSQRAVYAVPDTDSRTRSEINRIGAEVLSVDGGTANIEATPQEAEALRQAGFGLRALENVADTLAARSASEAAPGGFPPEDQGYHTYAEMTAELETTANERPEIAAKFSAGKSFEGNDIPLLKVSDNVRVDEDEPEVLFNCNQHAREHLTTEMCLRIAKRFTAGYANDPKITEIVDNRELWIIPMMNPDGSRFDVESGQYRGWRKNRQATGTDLNRNWGHKWGCCGGSSGVPTDETYRGSAPFSAPETSVLRDFVNSRVIDGKQQIKAAVDFHTYSELVLWPFGHTPNNVTEGMTQTQYDRFARVGTQMANTNGYTPQQSSELYVTDGDSLDWLWGQHKILAFTFEMFPGKGGMNGFYPPDEVIPEQTARNDAAVDILLREAGA